MWKKKIFQTKNDQTTTSVQEIECQRIRNNSKSVNEKDSLIVPHIPEISWSQTNPVEYESLEFYTNDALAYTCYVVLCVLSGGIFCVLVSWWPQLYTRISKKQVYSVLQANSVLIVCKPNEPTSCMETSIHHNGEVIWFEFKHTRYIYSHQCKCFHMISASIDENSDSILQRVQIGLSSAVIMDKSIIYGPNSMQIPTKPAHRIFVEKLFHPFYLFQILSVVLWLMEYYYTYSISILIMSLISITYEVYTQVRNVMKMQSIVQVEILVLVVRNNTVLEISSHELVIGDIVIIREGIVAADLVLLQGECTADESSLTGETIPVNKQWLHGFNGTINIHTRPKYKESVIYNGSTIIHVKPNMECRAVVESIGFSTSKGELFRSILFPKKIVFQIEKDSYKYLFGLIFLSILVGGKSAMDGYKSGATVFENVIATLDLISTAVPAALPLILTVGIGFSLIRLQVVNIFCIDAQRINICGQLNCICFDKTGTLTSDCLHFYGLVPYQHNTFQTLATTVTTLPQKYQLGLASCHNLINQVQSPLLNHRQPKRSLQPSQHQPHTSDGLSGFPLEIEMLRLTNYQYMNADHYIQTITTTTTAASAATTATTSSSINPISPVDINIDNIKQRYNSILVDPVDGTSVGYLRRFAFDASIQRSSVLIENVKTNDIYAYVKGSPESIRLICTPESIPVDYKERVDGYSCQGFYCLAMGRKELTVEADSRKDWIQVERIDIESNMEFIGFLLFMNPIKEESKEVIQALEYANIEIRIITGDNALTAIQVCRSINMVLSKLILLDIVQNTCQYTYVDGHTSLVWQPLHCSNLEYLLLFHDVAITGNALETLALKYPFDIITKLLTKCKIFARIRPEQKTYIVDQLIKLGLYVGMVGDGTNDCGALKAAHVGLALSDAEASIVAPFTSREKDISDVLVLIREGRCALTTSILAFKYMIMYPIIQVTMVSTLYHMQATLSNNQYLFDDLFVVLGLSVLMLQTKPANSIPKSKPPETLFAMNIVLSLLGQSLLYITFFIISFQFLSPQPWFCSLNDVRSNTTHCYKYELYQGGKLTVHSYENDVAWLTGHLQYVILAFAFNLKDPFRQYWYTNRPYLLYILLLSLFLVWLLLDNSTEWLLSLFDILPIPVSFRYTLGLIVLSNLVLSITMEKIIQYFLH